MSKEADDLYHERAKRVDDAIHMRRPDRVPLEIAFGYFPAKFCGISCEAAYYDYDVWLAASKKTLLEFGADISGVQNYMPGKVLEILEPRSLTWPGHGASAFHSHQIIEGEWMKADEYKLFFDDPTDFNLRYYLPRISGVMAPFSSLQPLSTVMGGYSGALLIADAFSQPEIAGTIEKLQKAGKLLREEQPKIKTFSQEIRKLGFPPLVGG